MWGEGGNEKAEALDDSLAIVAMGLGLVEEEEVAKVVTMVVLVVANQLLVSQNRGLSDSPLSLITCTPSTAIHFILLIYFRSHSHHPGWNPCHHFFGSNRWNDIPRITQ